MTLAFGFNAVSVAEPEAFSCAAYIVTAFILSGIAHVLWLSSTASRRFAVPIDCGASLLGKRILGDHKMFRGFVVMIPATSASFLLVFLAARSMIPAFAGQLWPARPWLYAALGAWAGFGFMAGELPNSFVKRRLDIAPGRMPQHPAARFICLLVDRFDSILGMLAALSVVVPVPAFTWIYVIVLGVGIHWMFSVALFFLGTKERMA